MIAKVLGITAILCLVGASVHGAGGFFLFGGQYGYAVHIGTVADGTEVLVELVALDATDLDLTCPLKATLFFVAANNSSSTRKSTFRRNATSALIQRDAPYDSEAFLVVQTQNSSRTCVGQAIVVVGLVDESTLTAGRGDLAVEGEPLDPPAEEPVPADLTDPRLLPLLERYAR